MLFNSLGYAVFLPIVFIIYWLMPHKYRWIFLLGASYYFYMSWNPKYVILILGTTLLSYLCALKIEKTNSKKTKKVWIVKSEKVCKLFSVENDIKLPSSWPSF